MRIPDSVLECPHCGSDYGYEYRLRIEGIQQKGFGGGSDKDYFDDTGLGYAGTPRCQDCRRYIRHKDLPLNPTERKGEK